jgi:hypothetical protein
MVRESTAPSDGAKSSLRFSVPSIARIGEIDTGEPAACRIASTLPCS